MYLDYAALIKTYAKMVNLKTALYARATRPN